MDRIWRVVRQWKTHFESFDVPLEQIERIAPAFRHIDTISSPELRRQL
jgi:serine/threonine-protein kinase HipA